MKRSHFMTNIFDFLGVQPKKRVPGSKTGGGTRRTLLSGGEFLSVSSYFSIQDIDQGEIILRQPSGELAKPSETVCRLYTRSHGKMSSMLAYQFNEGKLRNNESCIGGGRFFLTEIVRLIQQRKFDRLISYIKTLPLKTSQYAIVPYIGYMASICLETKNKEENQLYFVKIIEKMSIPKEDYPTFIHLLDEIRCLEINPDISPLLVGLMKFRPKDFSTFMSGGYRLVPGYYQSMVNLKGTAQTKISLSLIQQKANSNIPKLIQETESLMKKVNDNMPKLEQEASSSIQKKDKS